MGVKEFEFCHERNKYKFAAEKAIRAGKVYRGRFTEKAPRGLEANTVYCLKVVTVKDPADETWAASRECYDLVPFEGEHLRELLLQDDSAKTVAEQIKKDGHVDKPALCMVIEPNYESLKDYFNNCANYTVATRLDIVLQFALGSRELSKSCNQIGGISVLAHRDLKWENGVAERKEERLHIRLIDFATIWLGRDATPGDTGTKKASSTKKGALSPENTSPDSVIDGFTVSEKTDVYALGMLLASLFMLHKGKYVNPSKLWLEGNGWSEESKLADAFKRCLNKYDTEPDPIYSWVEQDLNGRMEKPVQWEALEDPAVLRRIRELFRRATRIASKERITREDFIGGLRGIIKMEKERAAGIRRQPVSVYLFNGARAQRYKADYQLAAEQVFRQETLENGGSAVHALCISYTGPGSNEKVSRCLRGQTETPCRTVEELQSRIQAIEPGRETDVDLLLYGIHAAATFLHAHKDRFRFTGQVYLLTPRVPTEDEMCPFVEKGRTVDLQELCSRTLDELCGKQTRFYAFTSEEPDPQAEEWCECRLLRETPGPESIPESKPEPVSETKRMPEPEKTPDVNDGSGVTFDVRPTAPYITLPGGKRVFVGVARTPNP